MRRVYFQCPGCGTALQHDLEDRWSQTVFDMQCFGNDYFACSQKFRVETDGVSKAKVFRGKHVLPSYVL